MIPLLAATLGAVTNRQQPVPAACTLLMQSKCHVDVTHSVQVSVDERHVIIACHAVAQGREPLVYPLHNHFVGERIADVEELCGQRTIHPVNNAFEFTLTP